MTNCKLEPKNQLLPFKKHNVLTTKKHFNFEGLHSPIQNTSSLNLEMQSHKSNSSKDKVTPSIPDISKLRQVILFYVQITNSRTKQVRKNTEIPYCLHGQCATWITWNYKSISHTKSPCPICLPLSHWKTKKYLKWQPINT